MPSGCGRRSIRSVHGRERRARLIGRMVGSSSATIGSAGSLRRSCVSARGFQQDLQCATRVRVNLQIQHCIRIFSSDKFFSTGA